VDRIGDYHVEREIRRDDGATTYKAVHVVLPRHAALRVLDGPSKKPIAMQIFREACILEALHHPGIPRVFECGVLPDKRPWVAMELIEGPTLGELYREGPLAIVDLVVALRTIGEVLEHAHGRGVMHQRLDDSVIVRAPGRHSPFTVIGWGGVGTGADPSRDVRALGTLAFRALTGAVHEPSMSARSHAPAAPVELAELIDDMLSRGPAIREIVERSRWLADTVVPRRATQEIQTIETESSRQTTFSIRINRG
jgi:hypothetical protein